jgi:hypothetical protein
MLYSLNASFKDKKLTSLTVLESTAIKPSNNLLAGTNSAFLIVESDSVFNAIQVFKDQLITEDKINK